MFAEMMATALLALGAENLLFAGGSGFSRALRSARRPAAAGRYALLVAWFSLASALIGFRPLPPFGTGGEALRPACFAAAAAGVYAATAALLRFLLPALYRRVSGLLAPAAVNTVVLAMPYVRRSFSFGPAAAAGYALGTGLAFYLASLLLAGAEPKCRNADMPAAFRGLPAAFLYVGILSMAFAGFTGGRVF